MTRIAGALARASFELRIGEFEMDLSGVHVGGMGDQDAWVTRFVAAEARAPA